MIILLLSLPPIVASCAPNDQDDAKPEVANNESGLNLVQIELTGICSVIGSSFAIVPCRSHELVIAAIFCKSSDQKYPQVVPSSYNIHKIFIYSFLLPFFCNWV